MLQNDGHYVECGRVEGDLEHARVEPISWAADGLEGGVSHTLRVRCGVGDVFESVGTCVTLVPLPCVQGLAADPLSPTSVLLR